jgi:hypothetical protein
MGPVVVVVAARTRPGSRPPLAAPAGARVGSTDPIVEES